MSQSLTSFPGESNATRSIPYVYSRYRHFLAYMMTAISPRTSSAAGTTTLVVVCYQLFQYEYAVLDTLEVILVLFNQRNIFYSSRRRRWPSIASSRASLHWNFLELWKGRPVGRHLALSEIPQRVWGIAAMDASI